MNNLVYKGLALLFFVTLAACSTNEKKTESAKGEPVATAQPAKNELPNITLFGDDGKAFSATTLPGNAVLIFFITDCDHCQREATDLQKNLAGFEKYNLYFISMEEFGLINKFATDYKLNGHANVHFLRADGLTVFNSLGNLKTPTLCVYDHDKKLTKRFDGETKVADLLKVL
jgi:peroxiredoxin